MNLTLVISSLGAGGAERVMTRLAGHWAAQGRDVTMLTFDDGSAPDAYELSAAVRRVSLSIAGGSRSKVEALRRNRNRLRVLRRALLDSRPDAVVSFMDRTNVLTLLASRGLGVPVIVAERMHPVRSELPAAWRLLRRWTYPHAFRVVAQSRTALDALPAAARAVGTIIPNPVPRAGRLARPDRSRRIVAMGRLAPPKGFDRLIRAFAGVAPSFPEWDLVIWGEGPERRRLEELRAHLRLDGRVQFPGHTAEVPAALIEGGLFVLSSLFEGFPNALTEAMSHGLPCVAFDCPSGPREIIRPGVDGILVPPGDTDALTEAMRLLMANPEERTRLAGRALEVATRFSTEKILALWDAVLDAGVAAPARAART